MPDGGVPLFLLLPALACFAVASESAFVDVNVIPMDRERVLSGQTVLVRDGVIFDIGPNVKVPAGAKRIEGKGKFLIPGLADMHNHLFSDDDFPDELADDELRVMVANGVTTSRLMIGTPEQLVLRERIRKGELAGPTLYLASPQLTGQPRTAEHNGRLTQTAEEGRKAVQDFKAAGYDVIKLTYAVKQPAYDAIIEEGKKLGIPIVGHVDPAVGALHAIKSGQQIEHLDAYLEAILKDDSPVKTSVSSAGLFRKENWASMDHIDEAKLKSIAQETAKAGIYSTPTLNFFKYIYGQWVTEEQVRAWPDFRFMPKKLVADWDAALKSIYTRIAASKEHRDKYMWARRELTKQIHLAGGKIMAGSDSPDVYFAYGFTIHRELLALVEAGLSPYAALEAATRNPAEFLKGPFGVIEKGRRADFLLLHENPLEDITRTEKRVGVMLRGTWYPQADLDRELDTIAEKFAKVP